eukprot:3640363-Prymnesium_polylepis.1
MDDSSISSCESCDEAHSWRLEASGGAPGAELPARGLAARCAAPIATSQGPMLRHAVRSTSHRFDGSRHGAA